MLTPNIYKNPIAPKSGAEPLTIIEFSLTNETKAKLEALLQPYVKGEKKDLSKLGDIFSNPDNFPEEVLSALKKLNRQQPDNPAEVYVVKNLPELGPERFKDKKLSERFIENHTYANYIGIGVGQAIGLPKKEGHVARRFGNPPSFQGSTLHKHNNDVIATSGVYVADGIEARTRFTDMDTLLESIAPGTENDLKMHSALYDQNSDDPNKEPALKTFPLSKLPEHHDYKAPAELYLNHIYSNKFNELARDHSQEIVIEPGDLVLWSNHGRIFHQALAAKDDPYSEDDVTRILLAHGLNKESSTRG